MYDNNTFKHKKKIYSILDESYQQKPETMRRLIETMDQEIKYQVMYAKTLVNDYKKDDIVGSFVNRFNGENNVEEVLHHYFEPSKIISYDNNSMYNNLIYSLKFTNQENSDILVSKSIYHNKISKPSYLGVLHSKRWQNEHEILIGLIINKTLGRFIPNFIITCGFRLAGPVFLLKDNIGITPHELANNSNINEYYLYTELINAKPLSKVLPFINLEQFLNLWYQICYALEIAQYYNAFTHYDFHLGNILIEELEEEIVLPYFRPSGDTFIKTKYIVRIIDYGFAYIEYEDKKFGFADPELKQFNRTASFHPFQDIYTLINSVALHFIKNNLLFHPIYRACEYWMKFFNKKDILISIVELQKSFFFPFYTKAQIIKLNMSDFINYSQSNYPYTNSIDNYDNDKLNNFRLKNINKIEQVIANFTTEQLLQHYEKRIDQIVYVDDLSQLNLSMIYCNLYFDLYLLDNNIVLTDKLQRIIDDKNRFLQYYNDIINNEPNKELKQHYKKKFLTYVHYCLLDQ